MRLSRPAIAFASAAAALFACIDTGAGEGHGPLMLLTPNAGGIAATYSTAGPIDFTNPFFLPLGTNGRSCDTCHQAADGWSVTPEHVRARFAATAGKDPLFRLNDGANSPNADVSTVAARRKAYNMLLDKGLIRVGIGIPAEAEFELTDIDDPYGYASAKELSLFRRPLPAANLKFLSTVMWDGRETFTDSTSQQCVFNTASCFASLQFNLGDQANGATLGHAQAALPLTEMQKQAIVSFETSLFVAQMHDADAKELTAAGAEGGPHHLAGVPTYFGINDTVAGDYRTRKPFDATVFDIYAKWNDATAHAGDASRTLDARASIARGEALFNSKSIHITGVKGLNDDLGVRAIDGTCTTCHNTPGAGNHSIPMPLDIGIADGARATPDMPLYVLRNKATGDTISTTDPGRALLTGKWRDIGRFKGPVLRALAARPPYFHNGSARDLREVVQFYDERFGIGFTPQEREDLVAFLRAL